MISGKANKSSGWRTSKRSVSWSEANNAWSSSAVMLCCSISRSPFSRFARTTKTRDMARTAIPIRLRINGIPLFLSLSLISDSPSAWEDSAASPGSAHKPSDKPSLFPLSTIGDLARQSSTHVSPAWLAPLDSTDCQDIVDTALANVLHCLGSVQAQHVQDIHRRYAVPADPSCGRNPHRTVDS